MEQTHSEDTSTDVVDLTEAEYRRLRRQVCTLLMWFQKRCWQLREILAYLNLNVWATVRDCVRARPELTVESLVRTTCCTAKISTKTFRKWRKEFILTGGFARSERGRSQGGWLLVNNDKKTELTHWLKSQKELSVRQTRDWINDCLLTEFPVGRVSDDGVLCRPVSVSTAHRWMLTCGCTYEPATKTYLTDSHESHNTLLYRLWFCDLSYFLSQRMHRWACFSSSSLKKLKAHYKKDWPHDSLGHEIPVTDVGQFPPGCHFSILRVVFFY